MTLEQVRRICEEIIARYRGQAHTEYHETRKDDKAVAYLTLKFKIDGESCSKKSVDGRILK